MLSVQGLCYGISAGCLSAHREIALPCWLLFVPIGVLLGKGEKASLSFPIIDPLNKAITEGLTKA